MTSLVSDPRHVAFVEKYRPNTVESCILPERFKKIFQAYVIDGKIDSNILISGTAGVGKTTILKALFNQLNIDFLEINASLDRNIDTVRTEIQNFASTVSLMSEGHRKMVLIDEIDGMSEMAQKSLRNFMEAYAANCGFVATCNYKSKVIEPLQSRFGQAIEFNFTKKELADLGMKFAKRVYAILEEESIPYQKEAVMAIIAKCYPDFRKTLNTLQAYSKTGQIDSGILVDFGEERFKDLIKLLREGPKQFNAIRRWIGENEDITSVDFYRKFYDTVNDYLVPSSVPQMILFLGKYQDMETRVADTQINRASFLVEVLADCQFKE
ncbi:clamp loader large subunit [Caulobacter phage Cr30]|uniref:clamp loader of DNA polymerase n=1 Tax=Caulobacter phage Cr30 TaxID=1357714 RepID=UPI0004A9B66E|nr:clamp loader of DNA polymerase [Caulobacter phage Cr30]AGS81021.1 clamp loader large subunit [Caulobacter phage Cr30]